MVEYNTSGKKVTTINKKITRFSGYLGLKGFGSGIVGAGVGGGRASSLPDLDFPPKFGGRGNGFGLVGRVFSSALRGKSSPSSSSASGGAGNPPG